ncbi:phosphotransferase [Rhodospirillaceae bacterium SYSU D60014]|uniref:phosphotransferase n=1 Tax=Virgifigura deserti TaxID=2268457 RepID=UPI0013C411D5
MPLSSGRDASVVTRGDGDGGGAADLTNEQLREVLRHHCALSPSASVSIEKTSRIYSTIWSATISENGSRRTHILKQAGKRAERQVWLSQRADRLFFDQPFHASPGLAYEPGYDLTIARLYPGRSLEALMAEGGIPDPFRWYRDLSRRLGLAGIWLKHYHRAERRIGSVSGPLMAYLEQRRDQLDHLPALCRQRLLGLVESDLVDDIVVTHSDFSPGNILSDGRTLCVIDFGIKEWTEMSPWWDVVTILTALDRYFLFRRTCPVYWIRPLLSRLKSTFWTAYSSRPPHDQRSFLACAAVRHFSFAGDLSPKALDGSPRSRWHLAQLEQILDKL